MVEEPGFALLFGTTWLVNAIVFASVLTAVLIAVEFTRRWPTPPIPVLFAALLTAWLVPAATLLELPIVPRLVIAVALVAMSANLLGAMVGGCLEAIALVVGYNALLLLAGRLYAAALVVITRADRAPATLAVERAGGVRGDVWPLSRRSSFGSLGVDLERLRLGPPSLWLASCCSSRWRVVGGCGRLLAGGGGDGAAAGDGE